MFQEPIEQETKAFEEARIRSAELQVDVRKNPLKYRALTGDRPTGPLHVGHLFGSVQNRVALQNLGITTFVLIADYQVFTDRDLAKDLSGTVREIVLDYMAAGLDPFNGRTFIFCHSQVPELNQLLLPFLALVSMPELDKNPTVKEEIRAAGLRTVQAIMYTYPVHQAADILSCKSNVVPVGKDQLPHLELTRKIARRFNERFSPNNPVFPIPDPLLSEAPLVLGLDGNQKMSKSRGNAIALRDSEDQTREAIKKAKTDSERSVTYEPERRPEVANLLRLAALCTGKEPSVVAQEIGNGGGGALKKHATDALNAYLAPLRARRQELAADDEVVRACLKIGSEKAQDEARLTLEDVRNAMGTRYIF